MTKQNLSLAKPDLQCAPVSSRLDFNRNRTVCHEAMQRQLDTMAATKSALALRLSCNRYAGLEH